MRFASASALAALLLSACTPRPQMLSVGDLEPPVTQVTTGRSGADRDPEVSRDGRTLFYASTAHGERYDLYQRTIGSNTSTRLTSAGGDKRFPRISPVNPKMLAYCSNERGSWELCLIADLVDAPTTAVVLSDRGTDNLHPSWSPDGKKIVYCSTHEGLSGDWVLKVKDLETGKTHVLDDVDGLLPDWSPVGNKIVFQRMKRRDDWLSSIWTLDFDNGAARHVTSVFSSDDFAAINPCWSPDGQRIAFATVGKSQAHAGAMSKADDLWIVSADGMNPTRITTATASDWMPSWSTDNRLYFISDRTGGQRIWSLVAP